MAKKSSPTKAIVTQKIFTYTDEEINLSFTLDVDNSRKLRKFKGLLETATKDIEEILAGMKN